MSLLVFSHFLSVMLWGSISGAVYAMIHTAVNWGSDKYRKGRQYKIKYD